MEFLVIGLVIVGVVAALGWYQSNRQSQSGQSLCDLRRCIVIVGPEQNHEDCVVQRRALKPLLVRVRHLGMNVIEIYGESVPRRNGRPIEWLDNAQLRKTLKSVSGFHLICLDDDAEVNLHGRRPVSQSVLSEFIALEEPLALPAPDPVPSGHPGAAPAAPQAPAAAPTSADDKKSEQGSTSWGSVGVLR